MAENTAAERRPRENLVFHPSQWWREFPLATLPQAVIDARNAGTLIDVSWHNDTCPSFAHASLVDPSETHDLRLWVSEERPEDREYSDGPRFGVILGGAHPGAVICATENITEALAALASAAALLNELDPLTDGQFAEALMRPRPFVPYMARVWASETRRRDCINCQTCGYIHPEGVRCGTYDYHAEVR